LEDAHRRLLLDTATLRVAPAGTRIELPKFRDAAGIMRPAVTLPDEVRGPIGDAVLDALIDHGLAKHRFATSVPARRRATELAGGINSTETGVPAVI
jgi:hypothetical protein